MYVFLFDLGFYVCVCGVDYECGGDVFDYFILCVY